MDSTVKIHFEGLAACCYNGKNWEVVFICDDTHVLNFYDTRAMNKTSLRKAKRINIRAEGSVVPRKPFATETEESLNFNKVFNMTASYSHDKGVKRKRGNNGFDQNRVDNIMMTLENAFFFSAEQTDKKYDSVELINDEPTKEYHVGYVANVVGAKIVLGGAGRVEVAVEGVENSSVTYDLGEGEILNLIFDNNCETGKCHQESDFRMYYNFLEDKNDDRNKKREFEVKIDENVEPFDENKMLANPGRVNCYPVRISDEMSLELDQE